MTQNWQRILVHYRILNKQAPDVGSSLAKKDIKKNYGKSPDKLDALALTFAEKVRPKDMGSAATRYLKT